MITFYYKKKEIEQFYKKKKNQLNIDSNVYNLIIILIENNQIFNYV